MTDPQPPDKASSLRALIFGGILPIVAFTVLEEWYGTLAGIIAGMVFGCGEMILEWRKTGRVETLTWAGTTVLLLLGGVSLLTNTGIWFKLQPAILEAVMGFALLGTWIAKKPLLVSLMKRQGALNRVPSVAAQIVEARFSQMTFRLALFFLAHAVLATYAAFFWSTRAWGILKGVGFTVSLILYMVCEMFFIRRSITRSVKHLHSSP